MGTIPKRQTGAILIVVLLWCVAIMGLNVLAWESVFIQQKLANAGEGRLCKDQSEGHQSNVLD